MSDNENTAAGAYKRDESKREELEREKLMFNELEKRIAATKYLWGCTSSSERVKVNNYPFGFMFGTNIWAPSSEDYLTWQTSSRKSSSSDNDINNPEFGLKSSQSSNNLSMSQISSSQLSSSDEMESSCQQQISTGQPTTSSELGTQSNRAFTFKTFTSSQLRSQQMPYDEDNDCQQPTANKSTNQDEKKKVWVLDSSWDNVPTTSTHGSQLWCNVNDVVNNNLHIKQQVSASNPTFSIDYGNFANVTNIVRYPWRSYYYESGNAKFVEQHLGDSASSIHHHQNRSNDFEFCYSEPNSDEIYFHRFQAGYRVGSQNWFHEDDSSSTTSTSTVSQYTSANLQSPVENQRQFSGNQWSGSAELQPNAFAQNLNYMNGSRNGVDKNKRHRMSARKYKSQEKNICTFCKKNGEPASSYNTHLTKDDEGNIICPILKAYVCQKCGATGRSAHTDKYCHYN